MSARFKYIILFASLLYASGIVYSAFSLDSLTITAYVRDDGSAYIREEYNVHITGNDSIKRYSEAVSLLKRNDIQAWRDQLGIPVIYHLGGQPVSISDFTITPEPIVTSYTYVDNVYVSIALTYTVDPPTASSGLFIVSQPTPRTLRYSINKNGFMFETTSSGGIILPPNTKLTFVLPDGITITRLNPLPNDLSTSLPPIKGVSTLTWERTSVLSGFSLEFEKELPLETEITAFLDELSAGVISIFTGPNAIPAIVIIITLVIAIAYLHRIKRKAAKD